MKAFIDSLLLANNDTNHSFRNYLITKSNDRYHVSFTDSMIKSDFTLAELQAEGELSLNRAKSGTVLKRTSEGYKTDFSAKNLLSMPKDSTLVLLELVDVAMFAKNPEKARIENETKVKRMRDFRKADLFGSDEKKVGSIQASLRAQCTQYDWEKAKQQAAKLCGGVNVASRGNHIDFNASCINQKTDKVRSFAQANKQFEKASAKPKVTFKAKENYNSTGAVRGGSGINYVREPSSEEIAEAKAKLNSVVKAKAKKIANNERNKSRSAKRKLNKAKG